MCKMLVMIDFNAPAPKRSKKSFKFVAVKIHHYFTPCYEGGKKNKISTHLLTELIIYVIVRLEQRAMHNSVPASEKELG